MLAGPSVAVAARALAMDELTLLDTAGAVCTVRRKGNAFYLQTLCAVGQTAVPVEQMAVHEGAVVLRAADQVRVCELVTGETSTMPMAVDASCRVTLLLLVYVYVCVLRKCCE